MFSLYVPSNDVTGERLLPHWLVAGGKITHTKTTTVWVSYGVRSQAVDRGETVHFSVSRHTLNTMNVITMDSSIVSSIVPRLDVVDQDLVVEALAGHVVVAGERKEGGREGRKTERRRRKEMSETKYVYVCVCMIVDVERPLLFSPGSHLRCSATAYSH